MKPWKKGTLLQIFFAGFRSIYNKIVIQVVYLCTSQKNDKKIPIEGFNF